MRKESVCVWRVFSDPETGEVIREPDLTAKSISYSSSELGLWVKKGYLPSDLEEFAVEELEYIREDVEAVKKLKAGGASKKEVEEWFVGHRKSAYDIKKTLQLSKLLIKNKEHLKALLDSGCSKKRRFRQSGHFVDQKLKYKSIDLEQTAIFDELSPKPRDEIKGYDVRIQGIHLTCPQDKLINSLNKILCNKSETVDYKAPGFYLGNGGVVSSSYGLNSKKSQLQCRCAVIQFTPHELYSEYMGRKNYSGADISFIKETLFQLSEKKFLIIYDRHRKDESKGEVIDKIVEYQPLFKIQRFFEGLSKSESKRINEHPEDFEKGEIVVILSPIFTDQIDKKYIEYPADINKRMIIAAGGHNRVTESMICLRDWVLRAISNKLSVLEMNESTLVEALKLDKYVKQGRKKLLRERIAKDIQAIINLGLVLKVEKKRGARGQLKFIFHLNKEYDSRK